MRGVWELAVVWLVMWVAGTFIVFSYIMINLNLIDKIVKEYYLLMTMETWVPFP